MTHPPMPYGLDPEPPLDPATPCAYCLDMHGTLHAGREVECCEHGTEVLCPAHEQRAYARITCMTHGD